MQLAVVPRDYKGPKEINLENGEMWGGKGRHINAREMGNLSHDRDLSNGLCDISKCSWPREVYYEVLSSFFNVKMGKKDGQKEKGMC